LIDDDPSTLLEDMHRANGHGCIAGVHFDFRLGEIGEGREPVHALRSFKGRGDWGARGIWPFNKAPCLTFPWSPPPPKTYLRARAKLEGVARLRDLARYGPHGHANAGDSVLVSSVTQHWYGDEFDAPVDALLFRVRYVVRRPDGHQDRVRGYSIYVHRDSHWAVRVGPVGTQGGLSLDVVRNRLSAHLSPGDVDEAGNPTSQCEVSAANCLDILNRLEPEVSRLRGMPGSPVEANREQSLIEAGFYLAKAEAAVLMGPHAARGLVNEIALEDATEKRREAGNPVRAAARACIAANPKTSQGACVKEVASSCGVGQRSVERTIAHMFEWRALADGRQEKRPKAEYLPRAGTP
jgi:hypothetical protein